MTEDELLYAVLDDKIRECENNNYLSNTNFLDIYQQSKAIQYLQKFHICTIIDIVKFINSFPFII